MCAIIARNKLLGKALHEVPLSVLDHFSGFKCRLKEALLGPLLSTLSHICMLF